MSDPVTLTPARSRLALECTYELESLSDLILVACPDDAPEFRGLALRVRSLASVIMSVIDDEVAKEDDLRAVVYGNNPPAA